MSGQLHAEIRSAIIQACRFRGDSKEHQDACIREVLELPEDDQRWYLEYFKGQAK